MGLSDPFSTTAELAYKGVGGGIKAAVDPMVESLQKKQQQQQTLNMLKQTGLMSEQEQPYSLQELQPYAKKLGVELKTDPSIPEDQQVNNILGLAKAHGVNIPPKQKKTVLDIAGMAKAGISWNPNSGEMIMSPKETTEEWKPRTMQEAIQFEEAKQKAKGIDLTSVEGLTNDQQLQGLEIAKRFGVKNLTKVLPLVYAGIRQGKTPDQIDDEIRYGKQSKQFGGAIRNAAQSIFINSPAEVTQNAMDFIDDQLQQGNEEGVKDILKRSVVKNAPTADQTSLVGKERTIGLIREIRNDLDDLKKKGINTGIFLGTANEVAKKIGKIADPDAQRVAQKIQLGVQNYRRSMSGVAFPESESREYKSVFPGLEKDEGFNAANIDALEDVFSGDLDSYYSQAMGKDAYNEIFKGKKRKSQADGVLEASGLKGKDEVAPGYSADEWEVVR